MAKDDASPGRPNLKSPQNASYDVGYAKPPSATRFRKGVSGNPKGRPRGARTAKKSSGLADSERLKAIIKAEAYRTIRVPDGGAIVSMSMAEAVMRSIAVNAAKGHARSQRLFTDLVQVTERAEAELYSQYQQAMIEYKADWEKELERRERLGVAGPEPLPHPDDILVDMRTGRVSMLGPMTKEEKQVWDKGLAHRDARQQDFNEALRKSKRGKFKNFWRKEAVFEQYLYDRLNERLPPRYQKPLNNRIWVKPHEREALDKLLGKSTKRSTGS